MDGAGGATGGEPLCRADVSRGPGDKPDGARGRTARPLCGTVRLVAVVMPGYCTGGGYPESRASSGPRMVPPPTIGTPAPPCFFINPWLWNELPRAPLSGRALPGKADR